MKRKAKLVKLTIDELSGVDRPCHAPATVALMKREAEVSKGITPSDVAAVSDADAPKPKKVKCPSCGKYGIPGMPTCPSCNSPMAKRAVFERVIKQAVLTDEVEGHQHTIDVTDAAERWQMDQLMTSYQTLEGADSGHSHAWTFDPMTGAITVAADSGHSHTVTVAVPATILAAAAKLEADKQAGLLADSGAVSAPITDEKSSGATVVVVAARANSTPSDATRKVKSTMKTEAEIAALEKRAADAEAALAATTVEKADFATLEKRIADQESILKAQTVELAKARDTAERVSLEKRASETFTHVGKSIATRCALLKAVDSIADDAVRAEVVEALKGANVAMAELAKSHGINPGDGEKAAETPVTKFNAGRVAFAKAKHKTESPTADQIRGATTEFLATGEGAQLYAAMQQS